MKTLLILTLALTSCATTRLYYPSGQLAAKTQGDVVRVKLGDIEVEGLNHSSVDRVVVGAVSSVLLLK